MISSYTKDSEGQYSVRRSTVGVTERFEINRIEMQGTKFSNIKCSIQMDTIGKDCYSSGDGDGLFLFKSDVYVPPLGMIDDIITFSLSGGMANGHKDKRHHKF